VTSVTGDFDIKTVTTFEFAAIRPQVPTERKTGAWTSGRAAAFKLLAGNGWWLIMREIILEYNSNRSYICIQSWITSQPIIPAWDSASINSLSKTSVKILPRWLRRHRRNYVKVSHSTSTVVPKRWGSKPRKMRQKQSPTSTHFSRTSSYWNQYFLEHQYMKQQPFIEADTSIRALHCNYKTSSNNFEVQIKEYKCGAVF